MTEAGAQEAAAQPSTCRGCLSQLPATLLVCPACHRLVHAETLRQLAADAEKATATGDASKALAHWRRALELLPPESNQSRQIGSKVAELSRSVGDDAAAAVESGPKPGSFWARLLAPLGALGLVLWKLKFVVVLVASKLKLLLAGLFKLPTLLSILVSFGVYWTAWGWRFAAGLLATMYVHEIGHVAALKRLGIRATAPMFVPGLGAFVRMEQYPADVHEDAQVGLAGPIWGLGAALVTWAAWLATGAPFWGAITHTTAWLNLFNLLPVWQLDGGRGMRALSRPERVAIAVAFVVAWVATHDGLLLLLTIAAAFRAFAGSPGPGDRRICAQFLVLVGALAALSAIRLPELTP